MKTIRRLFVLAVLLLAPMLAMATQAPAHPEIDALIARVAQARGVVFIRNGSEHSASEAAAHLQRKLGAAHGRITTVEQFIEVLGTRSSMTGIAYRVRFADGHVIDSAVWLHQLLHELRSQQARRVRVLPPAAKIAPLPVPATR
jgi:hypothetical protein